jgi:hypothetical protein
MIEDAGGWWICAHAYIEGAAIPATLDRLTATEPRALPHRPA